jgi:hypothetical protein
MSEDKSPMTTSSSPSSSDERVISRGRVHIPIADGDSHRALRFRYFTQLPIDLWLDNMAPFMSVQCFTNVLATSHEFHKLMIDDTIWRGYCLTQNVF